MRWMAFVFGGLAMLIHVLFFCLESLFWKTPTVNKIFKVSAEQSSVMALMAYNQGFYNLFLALGVGLGLFWMHKGKEPQGTTLVAFGLLSMLGAALVLFSSSPRLLRGVLLQGAPPLLGLIGLWLSRTKPDT